MCQLEQTGKFKKDIKLAKKRGLDMGLLDVVVTQIEKLSKTKKPVYLAYGTSDIISDLNDLVPLYFIRNKNEEALTLKPYTNLDHNFFELDDNGKPNREKKHWNKVFMKFLNWVGQH